MAGGDGIRLGGKASGIGASIAISNFGGITNSGVISARQGGIVVSGSTGNAGSFSIPSFTGNIANTSAIIAATGIHIENNTTIVGAIIDTGTIQASRHGIIVDHPSEILASKTAIRIAGGSSIDLTISSGGSAAVSAGGVFDVRHGAIDSGTFVNSGTVSAALVPCSPLAHRSSMPGQST